MGRVALSLAVAALVLGTCALVIAPSSGVTATGQRSSSISVTSTGEVALASVRTTAVGSRGAYTSSVTSTISPSKPTKRAASPATNPSPRPVASHGSTPATGATAHAAGRPTASVATVAVATTTHVASTQVATVSPVSRATPSPGRSSTPTKRAPARPVAPAPAVTPASGAAATLATHLNPPVNIAPSPDFLQAGNCTQTGSTWSCANPCLTSTLTWPAFANDPACTNYVLSAINNARAVEHLGPMTLPSNWYGLTTAEQLFVVANLERTARGLAPYLGINAALSAAAQRAASSNQDPAIAAGFAIATDAQGYPAMGGAWSGGFSVLAADYIWMYDDGWGGSAAATSNVACTTAGAAGCWAHRDELLGYDPGYNPGVGLSATTCEMGVGFAVVGGSGSFVDLIEKPASTPPAMTFTWAADVVPYL